MGKLRNSVYFSARLHILKFGCKIPKRECRRLIVTTGTGTKNPGFAGILIPERSLLAYCFGGDGVSLEPLAGQLPVPRPMA